ncbi:MAG: 3-dehydroquinate synthase [Flavobacteriaceae bacterium]|nr:3-dehydroquinate synthase [Flavobacteriaceae bacterium]MDG1779845.1 3-dehydroquinate synthase [Flavobacteriales bacterium]
MEHTIAFSLEDLKEHLNEQQYSSVFVLVDENTHTHCLTPFHLALNDSVEYEVLEVPAGESSKSIEIAYQLWQAMIDLHADRKSCLINLGGGMITDLGGFIASTFKRGISFIHIPTTVLSMVDASIGGKTGVNLEHLKNQVGTFAQPQFVVADPIWLSTLSPSEIRSGFAEIIKHGLISPTDYLDACLNTELTNEGVGKLIKGSIEIKMTIVQEDPFEQNVRKALNFGHTAGHAYEALSHQAKTPVLHGDAVAWGMRVALSLSQMKSGFPVAKAHEIDRFLQTHYGEFKPSFSPKQLWELMLSDKKNEGGEVKFVLLSAPGHPVVNQTVTFKEFEEALDQLLHNHEEA